MTTATCADTDAMIARLRQVAESAENQARAARQPPCAWAAEEPICWHHVFGLDMRKYLSDPQLYFASVLRQKLWRWDSFPDDAAQVTLHVPVWLSHYPEYTFLGMTVDIDIRGVPHLQTDHPMTRDPDLRLLPTVDFKTSGWMPRILRWYEDVQRIANGRIEVGYAMTWNRGCLDLAIQLRGYDNWIADTVERPQFVHDLMKYLVEQRCRWYDGYYEHFGIPRGPVGIADDWINIPFITPGMFADFVLPYYLELERYHGGILSVHSCGDQTPVQQYLLELESLPTLEVSPWTDLERTLDNVPPDKHLCIALHPNDVLVASREEMESQLRFITEACRGRSYSIGSSGLTPVTPDIGRFVRQVAMWTQVVREVVHGGA